MKKCKDFDPKPRWKRGPYHYHYLNDECVLCGAGTYNERFRVAGRRPPDRSGCYCFKQHACDAHFM